MLVSHVQSSSREPPAPVTYSAGLKLGVRGIVLPYMLIHKLSHRHPMHSLQVGIRIKPTKTLIVDERHMDSAVVLTDLGGSSLPFSRYTQLAV